MSKKTLLISSFLTTLFYCFFIQVTIANDFIKFVPSTYCTENKKKNTEKNSECCDYICLTFELEDSFFKKFNYLESNTLNHKITIGFSKQEFFLYIDQKNNSPPKI